jgi:hypothetical protein
MTSLIDEILMQRLSAQTSQTNVRHSWSPASKPRSSSQKHPTAEKPNLSATPWTSGTSSTCIRSARQFITSQFPFVYHLNPPYKVKAADVLKERIK